MSRLGGAFSLEGSPVVLLLIVLYPLWCIAVLAVLCCYLLMAPFKFVGRLLARAIDRVSRA